MKRKYVILLLTFVAGLSFSLPAAAEVKWDVKDSWKIPEQPVDIVHSQDGMKTFLLTDQGNILIYSNKDGRLEGKVPVDASSVDGIDVSPNGDTLFLVNRKNKTVQRLSLKFKANFSTSGSPFLGAVDAPVQIVVFSDFQ